MQSPSKTFYNLPASKRSMLLRIAYQEFASNPYNAASITRIVKEMNIAKGSLYQYFENKQALYKYLVSNAKNKLTDILRKACPIDWAITFDQWYFQYLLISIKFYLEFPVYACLLYLHYSETCNEVKAFRTANIKCDIAFLSQAVKKNDTLTNSLGYQKCRAPLGLFEGLVFDKEIDLNHYIITNQTIYITTDDVYNLVKQEIGKG